MFLVFGKFLFLLSWKNVLSGSHALHFHFIRYKSVIRIVISVNRPFIIRRISGKRVFYLLHIWYLCVHCVASMLHHTPIVKALRGSIDGFCHQITKFCIFLLIFP